MTRSWRLTTCAAAIIALAISYARGETCTGERTRIVTRTVCEHVAQHRPVCEPRMFVECEPETRQP